MKCLPGFISICFFLIVADNANAQIGKRFPSERKLVKDSVTGTILTFLTSTSVGDSKIYQTHNQWTSDRKWLIFRSGRVKGEAMAVNEETGEMIQVTEGGYTGMLNIARNSMKLYFMRDPNPQSISATGVRDTARGRTPTSLQILEVDLEKLFKNKKNGKNYVK